MATSPTNNKKHSVRIGTVMPGAKNFIDSTVSFNQGDMIALVSGKLKAIAADGDTATMLGIAPVSISSGKLASPYSGTAVDSAQAIGEIPGPEFGGTFMLKLKSGEAFNPGDLVYPAGTVDAQTVSSSSNTAARKACGIYVGAAVASATSGQLGEVMIGTQITGALTF